MIGISQKGVTNSTQSLYLTFASLVKPFDRHAGIYAAKAFWTDFFALAKLEGHPYCLGGECD
jgi:hypothetical protein